jgi:hypothetical protein
MKEPKINILPNVHKFLTVICFCEILRKAATTSGGKEAF